MIYEHWFCWLNVLFFFGLLSAKTFKVECIFIDIIKLCEQDIRWNDHSSYINPECLEHSSELGLDYDNFYCPSGVGCKSETTCENEWQNKSSSQERYKLNLLLRFHGYTVLIFWIYVIHSLMRFGLCRLQSL